MPILMINGVECVECPCCKGKGYLVVYESIDIERGHSEYCTHCMGTRYIAVERPNDPLRFFGEIPL